MFTFVLLYSEASSLPSLALLMVFSSLSSFPTLIYDSIVVFLSALAPACLAPPPQFVSDLLFGGLACAVQDHVRLLC